MNNLNSMESRAWVAGTCRPAALNDPVTNLGRQIERGEVKLDYSPDGWGYLPSLLKHLDLNIDSQLLVFSKTSFQLTRISPKTPRALFSMTVLPSGPFKTAKSLNIFLRMIAERLSRSFAIPSPASICRLSAEALSAGV